MSIVRAEIVAVGSELLTPSRIDTNSLYITERLNEMGVAIAAKAVVGDDRAELADVLRAALSRADLVVVTGGLGPTDDDVTREAAADALGLALEEDAAIVEAIRQRFAARGLKMPEVNRKQALVLRGAEVLANAHGTAPGLAVASQGRHLLLLPGPPGEMRPMLDGWCATRGAALSGARHLVRRVLKIANMTESHVEEIAQPIYSRWVRAALPIATTILAAPGQIELHLTASSESRDAADVALAAAAEELASAIGPAVFTTVGESLEEVVGSLLRAAGRTISVAESCTGGLVSSRLTDVPGSSDYVLAGVVAYSNESKTALLGVRPALIEQHGAVSEPVAVAMAEGARERNHASIGVGITGIAGPGGGSGAKPVGTVAIATVAEGVDACVKTYHFRGGRQQIKFSASQAALDQVRRLLL
jgi:nicotinamide-nucleotide amidase